MENRTWKTNLRGRILLHASARSSSAYRKGAGVIIHQTFGHYPPDCHFITDLRENQLPCHGRWCTGHNRMQYGGFVGIATLADIMANGSAPASPWAIPGQYGFILTDIIELPLIPWKGALNLFNVDAAELRRAVVGDEKPYPKTEREQVWIDALHTEGLT